MEKLIVNTLQFNMSVPTPFVFMRRFLKAAQSDKKLELLSFYIIELCLVEYKMLKFPPSLVAAAAIFTDQCTIIGSKQWSKTSQWYSTNSEELLLMFTIGNPPPPSQSPNGNNLGPHSQRSNEDNRGRHQGQSENEGNRRH